MPSHKAVAAAVLEQAPAVVREAPVWQEAARVGGQASAAMQPPEQARQEPVVTVWALAVLEAAREILWGPPLPAPERTPLIHRTIPMARTAEVRRARQVPIQEIRTQGRRRPETQINRAVCIR
jgi:hypothetical protein